MTAPESASGSKGARVALAIDVTSCRRGPTRRRRSAAAAGRCRRVLVAARAARIPRGGAGRGSHGPPGPWPRRSRPRPAGAWSSLRCPGRRARAELALGGIGSGPGCPSCAATARRRRPSTRCSSARSRRLPAGVRPRGRPRPSPTAHRGASCSSPACPLGKSTIARPLSTCSRTRTGAVTLLDGDAVRQHLSRGLGFERSRGHQHRPHRVRRVAVAGTAGSRAAPMPRRRRRRAARALVERTGRSCRHVSTPLEVCEARDRKGLYARARAGELPEFHRDLCPTSRRPTRGHGRHTHTTGTRRFGSRRRSPRG